METLKEQDLRKFAEQKIHTLRNELRKWYAFVEALDSSSTKQADLFESVETQLKTKNDKIKIRIKENPVTLRERCEKILFDADELMTSRELLNAVEKRFKATYSFSGFSGSFSQAYRRKSSLIKRYDFQNPAIGLVAVYGLKTWFNLVTNEIEKEYLEKIYNKYGTK